MEVLQPFAGFAPRVGEPFEAAPSARIIGRTRLGAGCVLRPFATIRGDGQQIDVGDGCWFGEHSTVHIVHYTVPTRIGAGVTVARGALVHAVTVGDRAVIGEGAVLLDGADIGAGAAIAAHTLVPPRKRLAGGALYAGVPAVAVRPLGERELEALAAAERGAAVGVGDRVDAERARITAPDDALLCDTVCVEGRVTLGSAASVWFGSRILASGGSVTIGQRSNVQDNSTLVAEDGAAIEIGDLVTIGHNVTLEPCRVLEGALVANGSRVGRGALVEAGACVAAAASVPPGAVVAAGMVWAGRPARALRAITPEERRSFDEIPGIYAGEYRPHYLRR